MSPLSLHKGPPTRESTHAGALEVEAEGLDWKRVEYVTIEVAWPGSATVETALCWEHELRPCRIDDLAPGRYVVRLSVGDTSLQEEVGIAAGETAKLTFRLGRGEPPR